MGGSNLRLVLTHEASDEVVGFYDFYESQRAGWGDFFMDQLADCQNGIAAKPHRWQYALNKEDKVRRALISAPPVVILYLVQMDEVRILSVKDTRSDWKS